jgi:hypothetical protein
MDEVQTYVKTTEFKQSEAYSLRVKHLLWGQNTYKKGVWTTNPEMLETI